MKTIQCPSCNSLVPIPEDRPNEDTVLCPRCDERIPLSDKDAGATRAIDRDAGLRAEVKDRQQRRKTKAVWSVRRTFVVGVALGLLGLVVGFTWNLLTRVPKPPTTTEDLVKSVMPGELGGLGYLPDDTDAVFAVHCASLIAEVDAKGWGQTPEALAKLGLPESVLSYPEKLTGLKLSDLHHLVVGVRWSQSFPPQIVVILRTRKAYSFESLTSGMRVSAQRNERNRDLYNVENPAVGLSLVWWPANDRTLIVGLDAESLKDIPDESKPGIDHLRADLKERIRSRLAPETLIWLAGRGDKLNEMLAPLKLLGLLKGREGLVRVAGKLRGVTAGIMIREEVEWTTFAETDTPATATDWLVQVKEVSRTQSLRVQTGQPGNVCYFKVILGAEDGEKLRKLLNAGKP